MRKLIQKVENKLETMIEEDPLMAKEVLEKENKNSFLVKRFMKKVKKNMRKRGLK